MKTFRQQVWKRSLPQLVHDHDIGAINACISPAGVEAIVAATPSAALTAGKAPLTDCFAR